jgi:hypothetical protein
MATHVRPDSMHTDPDDRWNVSAYRGPRLYLAVSRRWMRRIQVMIESKCIQHHSYQGNDRIQE